IAVMGDCQLSFEVVDLNRLAVAQVIAAGGAVTDVTNSDLTMRKLLHFFLGKYFTNKAESLMGSEHPIFIDHNPAAFLAAMLECI
ncbi:MAG: hypothetical protein IIV13_08130, partial [Bacteroidaceae bacterium]|nr:hypothetical protein [Bacteroidaceae bacterium]